MAAVDSRSWRLPPLNSLKVFALAGTHQSFSVAAKELFVTVGAVSRQIKLLEDHLGISLFVRGSHDLALTPKGRVYHATICALLNRIEAGSNRLAGSARTRPLHLCCPMTFGLNWLMPRLKSFHHLYPEQQLRITTTLSPLYNLPNHNDVDISFQLADGATPGWVCHAVLDSRLTLGCSPKLLNPHEPVQPELLLQHPILLSKLQAMNGPDAWQMLTTDMDQNLLSKVRQVEYSSLELAIDAAIAGAGVVLAPAAFLQQDFDKGRLWQPVKKYASTGHYYYLVHALEASRDRRVEAFRNWLLDETRSKSSASSSGYSSMETAHS